MTDLISRQAAIDAVFGRSHEIIKMRIGNLPSAQPERCLDCINFNKTQMLIPQPEPHWHPCSERCPEENTPVNITWVNRNPVSYYADFKDVPFSATGVYFGGKWYWWSSIVEDLLAEYGRTQWDKIEELMDEAIEVIAWMPLPEPYKGVTE